MIRSCLILEYSEIPTGQHVTQQCKHPSRQQQTTQPRPRESFSGDDDDDESYYIYTMTPNDEKDRDKMMTTNEMNIRDQETYASSATLRSLSMLRNSIAFGGPNNTKLQ